MKSLLLTTAVAFLAVNAELYPDNYHEPQIVVDRYPLWILNSKEDEELFRIRRDVTVDRKIGDGRVFGTLGSNDAGLFGKGGYERNIFNDRRGKLDGNVHGTRVLSPYGDSSRLGGGLNWKTRNAAASLDLNKQIHGATSLNAQGGGAWKVGKNSDISAMGSVSHTFGRGRSDIGANANFRYRW